MHRHKLQHFQITGIAIAVFVAIAVSALSISGMSSQDASSGDIVGSKQLASLDARYASQEKPGYRYVGLDGEDPVWEPETYKMTYVSVAFDKDQSEDAVYDEKPFTVPESAGELGGFEFIGWAPSPADASGKAATTGMLAPGTEVDAQFSAPGDADGNGTVSEGERVNLLEWADGNQITLYAQWRESAAEGESTDEPQADDGEGHLVSRSVVIDSPAQDDSSFSRMITASAKDALRGDESGFEPVTVDGTTLEHFNVKWLTESTGENIAAGYNTLVLDPSGSNVPEHQFQVSFSISGTDRYNPGDLSFSFPLYIWRDRNNDPIMKLTANGIACPREGSEEANTPKPPDFVYKVVGDRVVVTNNTVRPAALSLMFQCHFPSAPAWRIPSGTYSAPLSSKFEVDLAGGKTLRAQSNSINAQLITHHRLNSAYKSAESSSSSNVYYIYASVPDNMPASFVPEDADERDYVYIRWYVSFKTSGNQPTTVTLTDTPAARYGGRILGVQHALGGANVKTPDGETNITTDLFRGKLTYDYYSSYVWEAIPVSSLVGQENPEAISNTITVTSTGYDDGITHTLTKTATAPVPQVYTVKKDWDESVLGGGDPSGYRDAETQVLIYRKRLSSGSYWVQYKTATLNDANDWTYSWIAENGTGWVYKVCEFGNRVVYGDYVNWNSNADYFAFRPAIKDGIEENPRVRTIPALNSSGEYWSYKYEGTDYDREHLLFTIHDKLYLKAPQVHRIEKVWEGDSENLEDRPESITFTVAKDLMYTTVDETGPYEAGGHTSESFLHVDYPNYFAIGEEGSEYIVSGPWKTVTLTDDGLGRYVGSFTDDDPFDHRYTVHESGGCNDWIGMSHHVISNNDGGIEINEEDGSRITYGSSGRGYVQSKREYHVLDSADAADEYIIANRYTVFPRARTVDEVQYWYPYPNVSYMQEFSPDYNEYYEESQHNEHHLNNIINGRTEENEKAPIKFKVAATSYHEGLTMDGDTVNDRGKRSVSLEAVTEGLQLEGSPLPEDRYRITKLEWSTTPVRTTSRTQRDRWSLWSFYSGDLDAYELAPRYDFQCDVNGYTTTKESYAGTDSREDYTAVVEGLVDGSWKAYATIVRANKRMSGTAENGATLNASCTQMVFPKSDHVVQVRVRSTSHAVGQSVMYDYAVELLNTPELAELMYSKLENRDAAVYEIVSSSAMHIYEEGDSEETRATDKKGQPISGKTAQATEYVHAVDRTLAVALDKSFTMTDDDKSAQQTKVHAELTLTQQSNIRDAREWSAAIEDGLVTLASGGIYYDLLPTGMLMDLDSIKLGVNDTLRDAWLVENYRGSGRTLLCVSVKFGPHVKYDPYSNPAPESVQGLGGRWPSGYKAVQSLSFDVWYPWDMVRTFGTANIRNVAAFEADEPSVGTMKNFMGEPDNPQAGNHIASRSAINTQELRDLMTDLDDTREDASFVYAGTYMRPKLIDYRATAGIEKEAAVIGADITWGSGHNLPPYKDPEITVSEGGAYAYRYTVAADSMSSLSDIVVVDSLETHQPDPADSPAEYDEARENNWVRGSGDDERIVSWQGYMTSTDFSELRSVGIAPEFWYTFEEGFDPSSLAAADKPNKMDFSIIEEDPAWHRGTPAASEWPRVKAFAVDCRKAVDGSDFTLSPNQSFSFVSYMRAPNDATDFFSGKGDDPTLNAHCYNSVFLGSVKTDFSDHSTGNYVNSSSTRIGIVLHEVNIKLLWDDADDNDGMRPDSAKVRLLADGEPYLVESDGEMVPYVPEITEDENGEWTLSTKHLPVVNDDNRYIIYSYELEGIDGYYISNIEKDGEDVIVTCHHDLVEVEVPFDKSWIDDVSEDGVVSRDRPARVTADLYADGVKTEYSKTVTAATDWKGSFTGIPK